MISRVKAVEVRMPKITTVANGLCNSAPWLVEIAIGTKPTLATRAVISTGRNRVFALRNAAWRRRHSLGAKIVEIGYQDHSVENAQASQSDESNGRGHRQRQAAQPQTVNAADQGERNAKCNQSGLPPIFERGIDQGQTQKNENPAGGQQSPAAGLPVLIGAAEFEAAALRELDLMLNRFSRPGNKTDHVRACQP